MKKGWEGDVDKLLTPPWWVIESMEEDGFYLRDDAIDGQADELNWDNRVVGVLVEYPPGTWGNSRDWCLGFVGVDAQLRRDGIVPQGARFLDFKRIGREQEYGVMYYTHADFPTLDETEPLPIIGEWREKNDS